MYDLIFTTKTPLHISNGEELERSLHYLDAIDSKTGQGKIHKLDTVKMARILANEEKIDFSKSISLLQLKEMIKSNKSLLTKSATAYSIGYEPGFKKLLENERAKGEGFIKEFISSNNYFYIPASSVKGALLTILGTQSLGIDVDNPTINDRFVLWDSMLLNHDVFSVYRSENRPPAINLICMKANTKFRLKLRKKGKLNTDELCTKLLTYNKTQVGLLMNSLPKYKSQSADKRKGADLFMEAIEPIQKLISEQKTPLINLGFGGGSWFKVNASSIPMFKSKKPKANWDEEAHTSTAFVANDDETFSHIGWCSLEVKEI